MVAKGPGRSLALNGGRATVEYTVAAKTRSEVRNIFEDISQLWLSDGTKFSTHDLDVLYSSESLSLHKCRITQKHFQHRSERIIRFLNRIE